MPITASGQISIRDIAKELRRPADVETSLDAAENGDYGAINRESRSQPSSRNPAAISEWYSYDHTAGGGPGGGGGLTVIQLGYSGRAEGSQFGEIEACSEFSSDQVPIHYAEDLGNWWTVPIFSDRSGLVYARAGWYSDQPYADGFTVRYWRGASWASQGALCTL